MLIFDAISADGILILRDMTAIRYSIKYRLVPLLAALALCLSAGLGTAYSQDEKIVMPLREATVKQVFDIIQRQSSHKVAVNWDDFSPARKVFLPAHEITVPELLRTSN